MNEPTRFLIFFAIFMVAALGLSGWIMMHHPDAETLLFSLLHHA